MKHGPNYKHGCWQRLPEYFIWVRMRGRCRDEHRYVSRGITVCKRWNNFKNFLADMGPRPRGHYPSGRSLFSIERINNDKGYGPSNCKWATYSEQMLNTSRRYYRKRIGPLQKDGSFLSYAARMYGGTKRTSWAGEYGTRGRGRKKGGD